jgi:hypothetical protein
MHFAEFLRSQVPYAALPEHPQHQYECINHRASFYVIFLETVSAMEKYTRQARRITPEDCDGLPPNGNLA